MQDNTENQNPIAGLRDMAVSTEDLLNRSMPARNTDGTIPVPSPAIPDFAGRELTDHKNNRFNRECINVVTADRRARDNAHHRYKIFVNRDGQSSNEPPRITIHEVELVFQNGGLKEVGPNGITDQALLAVVIDRMRSFNDGPYRCRENSMIITKLEEAMMWMEKRSNDRWRRGVEGVRTA